ncbi:MAG: zf-HC2 domain-containing protein [Oscillospiraceae bacterium]|nr:zf-HC2 domain-containing protein [Oscillospiraceae bacterium]
MNMTCESVRNLADLYHEKIVSREGAQAIRTHLNECPECRSYYSAYLELKKTERALGTAGLSGTQAKMYEELSRKLRRRRYLRIVGTSAAIGAGSIMLAVGILLTCRFNAESLMKR